MSSGNCTKVLCENRANLNHWAIFPVLVYFKKNTFWVWWWIPLIPALERQTQEELWVLGQLVYRVSSRSIRDTQWDPDTDTHAHVWAFVHMCMCVYAHVYVSMWHHVCVPAAAGRKHQIPWSWLVSLPEWVPGRELRSSGRHLSSSRLTSFQVTFSFNCFQKHSKVINWILLRERRAEKSQDL